MIILTVVLLFSYIIQNNGINVENERLVKRLDTTTNYHFEEKLIENLFKNYNKKIRAPNSIQVNFAFNLNQIINLVEKDQIVLLNAFIDHAWIDVNIN
jgi:hypothetical protein